MDTKPETESHKTSTLYRENTWTLNLKVTKHQFFTGRIQFMDTKHESHKTSTLYREDKIHGH